MKTHRTLAIVLRRTNYREADRVLQLLTPEGKRGVMARGVRREKSKLTGGIELFAVSDVVIGEGRGKLGVLTSAKLKHFYGHIIEDYDRLQSAYNVVKLVNNATETVGGPEWFDLLEETLAGLDALTVPLSLVETWFYLRYANLLGYGLNLETDVDGQKLMADKYYRYDVAEKGLRLVDSGDVSSEHIKLLRLLASKPLNVLVQIGGVGEYIGLCAYVARAHASVN